METMKSLWVVVFVLCMMVAGEQPESGYHWHFETTVTNHPCITDTIVTFKCTTDTAKVATMTEIMPQFTGTYDPGFSCSPVTEKTSWCGAWIQTWGSDISTGPDFSPITTAKPITDEAVTTINCKVVTTTVVKSTAKIKIDPPATTGTDAQKSDWAFWITPDMRDRIVEVGNKYCEGHVKRDGGLIVPPINPPPIAPLPPNKGSGNAVIACALKKMPQNARQKFQEEVAELIVDDATSDIDPGDVALDEMWDIMYGESGTAVATAEKTELLQFGFAGLVAYGVASILYETAQIIPEKLDIKHDVVTSVAKTVIKSKPPPTSKPDVTSKTTSSSTSSAPACSLQPQISISPEDDQGEDGNESSSVSAPPKSTAPPFTPTATVAKLSSVTCITLNTSPRAGFPALQFSDAYVNFCATAGLSAWGYPSVLSCGSKSDGDATPSCNALSAMLPQTTEWLGLSLVGYPDFGTGMRLKLEPNDGACPSNLNADPHQSTDVVNFHWPSWSMSWCQKQFSSVVATEGPEKCSSWLISTKGNPNPPHVFLGATVNAGCFAFKAEPIPKTTSTPAPTTPPPAPTEFCSPTSIQYLNGQFCTCSDGQLYFPRSGTLTITKDSTYLYRTPCAFKTRPALTFPRVSQVKLSSPTCEVSPSVTADAAFPAPYIDVHASSFCAQASSRIFGFPFLQECLPGAGCFAISDMPVEDYTVPSVGSVPHTINLEKGKGTVLYRTYQAVLQISPEPRACETGMVWDNGRPDKMTFGVAPYDSEWCHRQFLSMVDDKASGHCPSTTEMKPPKDKHPNPVFYAPGAVHAGCFRFRIQQLSESDKDPKTAPFTPDLALSSATCNPIPSKPSAGFGTGLLTNLAIQICATASSKGWGFPNVETCDGNPDPTWKPTCSKVRSMTAETMTSRGIPVSLMSDVGLGLRLKMSPKSDACEQGVDNNPNRDVNVFKFQGDRFGMKFCTSQFLSLLNPACGTYQGTLLQGGTVNAGCYEYVAEPWDPREQKSKRETGPGYSYPMSTTAEPTPVPEA